MKAHKPEHFVQRVKLEFDIREQRDAQRFQNEMSRVFNTYFKRILEKVLNEFDSPDYVIRINSLELDLGEILDTSFDSQLPKLFEEKLRKALTDIMGPPVGGRKVPRVSSKAQVLALFPAKIEMVQRFLVSGQVFSPSRAGNKSMEEILRDLLEESPEEVAKMLIEAHGQNRNVSERIANQFHSATFELIYKALASSYRAYLVSQESSLISAVTLRVTLSNSTATRAVRKAILEYLLKLKGGSFDTRSFRKAVGESLRASLGELVRLLFEDVPELSTQQDILEIEEARRYDAAANIVFAFLRRGTLPSDVGEFVQAWEYLSIETPQKLAGLIVQAGSPVPRLVQLLDILPIVAVQDFIARAVPSQSDNISLILAEVLSVYQAYSSTATGTTAFRNETLARLLQYAVTIADKPQSFSAREAIRRLSTDFENKAEVPKELRQALEKADLPGLSEILRADAPQATKPKISPEEAKEKAEAEKEKPKTEGRPAYSDPFEDVIDLAEDAQSDPELRRQIREREELAKEDASFKSELEPEALEEETQPEDIPAIEKAEEAKAEVGEDAPKTEEEQRKAEEKKAAQIEQQKAAEEQKAAEAEEKKVAEEKQAAEIEEKKAAEKKAAEEKEKELYRPEEVVKVTEVPTSKTDEEEPDFIDTVAGRIDYIEYFLRHGRDPWWVEGSEPSRFEQAISTLLKVKPEALKVFFERFVVDLPAAQMEAVVDRLVSKTSHKLILGLMQVVLPDLAGFMPVVKEVLETYFEAPPRSLSFPKHIARRHTFTWHYVVRFALEYLSSSPGAANMVKYVVQELGKQLENSPRIFMKEVLAVIDTKIAKGERKFSAFKAMLPLPFQELVVEPPKPHVLAPEVELIEYVQPSELVEAPAVESQPEILPEPQTETVEAAEVVQPLQPEEAAVTLEGEKVQPLEQEEKPAEEEEEPDFDPLKFEDGPTEEEFLAAEKAAEKAAEEAAAEEESAKPAKDPYWEEEPSIEAALVEGKPLSTMPKAMRYFRKSEDAVKVLRHYLMYGTMPGDFPIELSREEFIEFFNYLVEYLREPVFKMLKQVVLDRSVRLRLMKQSPQIGEALIRAFSPHLAEVMLPFMHTFERLVEGYSAPIRPLDVLEHAVVYAARVSSEIFSPLDYTRSLIQYAQRQLSVEPRALVGWMESKIDERQVPQKYALQQLFRTIRSSTIPKPAEKKGPQTPQKFRPLEEEIFVPNAGMVMVWPFLPQLFTMRKLLTADKTAFVDDESRSRAAHMLDYIVWKEYNKPEESMVLNKVLVGMEPEDTLIPIEELTEEETNVIEGMLTAACDRSGILKGKPGDVMREIYLQREGKLKRGREDWELRVQVKAYDVMLGRLAWGFNPVKLPWVPKKFKIEWK